MSYTSTLPLFETRHAAHARVTPAKQEMQGRILPFTHDRGPWGVTADELATAWSCAHNHSSPRITELAKAGKLIATKRRRPTRTGSAATVFALPEFS